MNKNSILTLKNNEGKIQSKKKRILQLFQENPNTKFTHISVNSTLRINDSAKRLSELLREGEIMQVGTYQNEGNYYSLYMLVKGDDMKRILRERQLMSDFNSWKRQGEKFKEVFNFEILEKNGI